MGKDKLIGSSSQTNNIGGAPEKKERKKEIPYAPFEKLFEG